MEPQRRDQTCHAILSVDTNASRFQRLKIAVRDFDHSIEIILSNNIDQALKTLSERSFAAVLLAPDFPESQMKQFVMEVLSSTGGRDAAVVLVISSHEAFEIEEQMSMGLLIGVNGFLREPFSVEGLQNTLETAKAVREDRLHLRQKQGLKFSLAAAKQLIDTTAALLAVSENYETSPSDRQKVTAAIRQCEQENPELYYRVLVGSFIRLAMSNSYGTPESYTGKSLRVKKIIAKKLLEREMRDKQEEALVNED